MSLLPCSLATGRTSTNTYRLLSTVSNEISTLSCQYPPRRHLPWRRHRSRTDVFWQNQIPCWSLSLLAEAASLNQTYSDNWNNHSSGECLSHCSRIDYCNAILTGVHDIHLWQLQGVLNAVARLIVHKKYDMQHNKHTTWRPALVADSTACRLQARCTHVQLPAQLGTRLYLTTMCRALSENPGVTIYAQPRVGTLWSMVPPTRTVRYSWLFMTVRVREHNITRTKNTNHSSHMLSPTIRLHNCFFPVYLFFCVCVCLFAFYNFVQPLAITFNKRYRLLYNSSFYHCF